jgi:hypothetical protein
MIDYGGVGVDEFLFTLDPTGKQALSLEPRVAGVMLPKTGTTAKRDVTKIVRRC